MAITPTMSGMTRILEKWKHYEGYINNLPPFSKKKQNNFPPHVWRTYTHKKEEEITHLGIKEV